MDVLDSCAHSFSGLHESRVKQRPSRPGDANRGRVSCQVATTTALITLLAAGMAAQANPRFSIPWILRTAALAKIGRIDEAKASAQRLLDIEPGFTVNSFLACNVTSAERLAEIGYSLREAGLREK